VCGGGAPTLACFLYKPSYYFFPCAPGARRCLGRRSEPHLGV
jgi:hypothetical protein